MKVLTGHFELNKQVHRVGLVSSPLCRAFYLKEEEPKHILCEILYVVPTQEVPS